MKQCTVCGQTKALTEFAWHSKAKGKLRSSCKECRNSAARAVYASDPVVRQEYKARTAAARKPFSQWSDEKRRAHRQYKVAHRRKKGALSIEERAERRRLKRLETERRREQAKAQRPHDAHVREFNRCAARRYRWRMKHDSGFRLNARLRVQIRKALKGAKGGRSWERLVGYSQQDLAAHLARMLPKRVTLDKALELGWHIDHIVPKSTFDLSDEAELAKAWALPNLRLIPGDQNIRKGAKRETLL